MKKLMFSLAAMTLVALTFTSCEKLDLFDKNEEGICDFVYPITLVMPDDAIVTVNDEDELDNAFEDWETNNPNSNEEPAFQYPLDVINADGETVTVNSDEELEEAFADCWDDKDDCYDRGNDCHGHDCDDDHWDDLDDCFDLVYPVSMTMPDSTVITANDEDALKTALENWYDANPNANDEPTFVYPITIVFEDGTTQVINDDDELEEALEDCFDWDEDECFDYTFPLSMTMPDGTVVSGNDEDELETAVENWYIANPNATAEPTFVYPITITFEDGTTQVINSDTELEAAYDSCDD